MDPNKGLVPLKLKLRDSAIPTGNKKPRARQRPSTDTHKRKTRQKIGEEDGDSASKREKSKRDGKGKGLSGRHGNRNNDEERAAEAMLYLSNRIIAADSEEIEKDR